MTKKVTKKKVTKKTVEKTCFVVMPISDIDGYDTGHFTRVYKYLIKPACEKAGFIPVRADDVKSSNYIVIDILSKIIESDIVICDLSGKNANVLYELGVRQAFNLRTVLIKDKKTDKIFDISGLRYTEYNQELRVDSVEAQIESISDAIAETVKAKGKDVNSVIQLLGLKPATLPTQHELSGDTRYVLSAVNALSERITAMEDPRFRSKYRKASMRTSSITYLEGDKYKINGDTVSFGDALYIYGTEIGRLADVHHDSLFLINSDQITTEFSINEPNFRTISAFPF